MLRTLARRCFASTSSSSSSSSFSGSKRRNRSFFSSSSSNSNNNGEEEAETSATKEEEEEEEEEKDDNEDNEDKVQMRHSSRPKQQQKSWEYVRGEPWGWLYDATPRRETIDRFPSQNNSILSDRVKTKMYLDHKKDPMKYSTENLAKTYMVREQRIMAILALKRREAEWIKNGKELDYDLEARFEAVFGTSERGAGERYYVDVPTYPSFEVLTAEEANERTPGLKVDPEKLAMREERELVRAFKEKLDYNTGVIGASLKKESRRTHAAKRPKGGFGLLVTPLGKDAPEPYVAEADGTKRPLNDDEEVFRRQRTIKPRRRIG
jgi:hypothetical protein